MPVRLRRRQVLTGLGAAGLLLPIRRATAQEGSVSDWVTGDHARVRLIDAGLDGAARLAGLQIQLDPGYLTYWRTPGEAGLPPSPDFSGSKNVASATMRFPAPGRFDEGGVEAFGYKDDVVFPIAVAPGDPGQPVDLVLALSFAVCGSLCLPASAALRIGLTGVGDGPEAELVRSAAHLVPAVTALGADGELAVLTVEPGRTPDRARVLARAAGSAVPALFVEAPDPWFVHAEGGQRLGDGRVAFDLRAMAGAKQPSPVDLTLTLVGEGRAIETQVHLELAAPG